MLRKLLDLSADDPSSLTANGVQRGIHLQSDGKSGHVPVEPVA